MDITVKRETLLKPLQAISSIVEKKQTMPILSNVLLVVQDGKLLLTGTDLEIELIGFVPIESLSTTGEITVSARKLFDICRALPEGILLRLSLENNSLIIRTQDSYFILNTLPTQDFPNLETSDYATTLTFQPSLLKKLFTQTYFAMGQQDVRHYLNGTFFEIANGTIKCIAADGHRLALTSVQNEKIKDITARMIVPRKSVLELMRLLSDEDNAEVIVQISDGRLRITTSDYTFTTKLIHAQYPDYNRLIPRGTLIAMGDREIIKQALTRASILSNEKYRGVRFQLEPNKLKITANNADQEQAEEVVSLDYSGTNMEIGFNVPYLLDVVSAIASATIRCAFTDSNSGVLIESTDDDESLYVVMPMRL
ncbi:MAG: DNA polymerase III subunit beta [Gammaproteobacteria bacterium RIFCSPHIGHO2_12_FULL_37_34]|nr:MAG: DNA polymerase III subunit beta [Gammaproteobacteria bacterium RIFCSPHIGHO2_12_FULL_37_34]